MLGFRFICPRGGIGIRNRLRICVLRVRVSPRVHGDHFDHRLENIEILCPNCHSYTDNYRGKNIKSSVGTDIQV